MRKERIEQLLDSTGPKWFGDQRGLIRAALLTVATECTQTRRQSLIEAAVGTFIGFCIALVSQVFLMWFYNLETTLVEDVSITVFFTVVSVIRSYFVRRFFNWRHK